MVKDMKNFTVQLSIYLCNNNNNFKNIYNKVEQNDLKKVMLVTSSHQDDFWTAIIMSEIRTNQNDIFLSDKIVTQILLPRT